MAPVVAVYAAVVPDLKRWGGCKRALSPASRRGLGCGVMSGAA